MLDLEPSADAIIQFKDVSKLFGSVHAVDHVSLDILRGDFFSLLGPSGCGKTTLLRMLAGFEQPTEGEIFIDGKSVAGIPANHRPTNMVFQSYAIFPHLNVEENVGYGLRNQKLSKDESRSRTAAALELVKLGGYGARAAHQLSGGQRQRVALARALVCRPKVLLLDEPLGALDKKLREEMQVELRQLQRNVGITFVFVTHDQEEALTLSDRIAVMSAGKVLQIARSEDLYENPNCREVAQFIGNMNLFQGTVISTAQDVVTVDAGEAGHVRANSSSRIANGSRVFLAVRSEKIVLSSREPSPQQNGFRGQVVADTYLGDRRRYLVNVRGVAKPIAVLQQNSEAAAQTHMNGEVWISWKPDQGRLLTH